MVAPAAVDLAGQLAIRRVQLGHAEQRVVEDEAQVVARPNVGAAAQHGEDLRLGRRRVPSGGGRAGARGGDRRPPALAQRLQQDRVSSTRFGPGEARSGLAGRRSAAPASLVERRIDRQRRRRAGRPIAQRAGSGPSGAYVGERVGGGPRRAVGAARRTAARGSSRRSPATAASASPRRAPSAVAPAPADRGRRRRGRCRARPPAPHAAAPPSPRRRVQRVRRAGSRRAACADGPLSLLLVGVPTARDRDARRCSGGRRGAPRGRRPRRPARVSCAGRRRRSCRTRTCMSSTVSGTRIAMPASSAAWKSTSQRIPGIDRHRVVGRGRRRRGAGVGPDVQVGWHRRADPGSSPGCRRDGRARSKRSGSSRAAGARVHDSAWWRRSGTPAAAAVGRRRRAARRGGRRGSSVPARRRSTSPGPRRSAGRAAPRSAGGAPPTAASSPRPARHVWSQKWRPHVTSSGVSSGSWVSTWSSSG